MHCPRAQDVEGLDRFGADECPVGPEHTLYSNAAIRAVEGALKLRQENGWFAENCLDDHLRPLTHTIGYTAQGILEVGVAAGRDDFVEASERCLQGILPNIEENGYLAGRFDSD